MDAVAPLIPAFTTGLTPGSALMRLVAGRAENEPVPVALICNDGKQAAHLIEQLRFFAPRKKILLYPTLDVQPYHGLSPHAETRHECLSCLKSLYDGLLDFIIIPKHALFRRVLAVDFFASQILKLARGDLHDREELTGKLIAMGYERSPIIDGKGQFAVRGDTLDIFSPQYDEPLRLSFFDIELDDIRFFKLSSQRTSDRIDQAEIIVSREFAVSLLRGGDAAATAHLRLDWQSELKRRADRMGIAKPKRDQLGEFVENGIYFHGIETFLSLFVKNTDALAAYFPAAMQVVNLCGHPLKTEWQKTLKEWQSLRENNEHIETIIAPEEALIDITTLDALEHRLLTLDDKDLAGIESNTAWKTRLSAQIATTHTLAPLASSLHENIQKGYTPIIVCRNEIQCERVVDLLKNHGITPHLPAADSAGDVLKRLITTETRIADDQTEPLILVGELHEGFIDHPRRQWWITDEEIFGKKTRRATSSSRKSQVFSSFSDISEGDYLIHMDHGIGIYRGLVKLDFDIHRNDFLLIEYLGGDKLYVPVDKLSRVQRFVAEEGIIPMLDKLGSTTWIKTRDKAKKAARRLARDLLEIQAKRQTLERTVFAAHTEACEEFSAAFEFDETPDQMAAIDEIMTDMGKKQPMDRVICGDVGYGKTEVAMRAAFRAIMDARQVAVLVPTTVLAFQHYQTFSARFANYPIKVELMSRFRNEAEQKEVIEKLALGQVDIVIGTHRLLSKDIKFSNLGLLVIDEEHRFGVVHKERIKKMRTLVDVLTLTATPIPRTLNFALTGIRDLSLITTPPVDRLAVRTYTCYQDDITLRDALIKEIRRGGQAFFVHNRVQSIERITTYLTKLVPEARVRFAHGQMEEGRLEDIMLAFMRHEFDILVSTTIIESGIDIPNANTMIINRADTFGLSQLYQLRGRIGRSHMQAYCYLIIPHENVITETAQKRLAAIQRFTELGSGFKIASYDLEIRGAGNILGDEQSGHIAAIGYDLYVHMLEAAVAELKNEHIPEDFEPEIKLTVAARIPEDMIPDTQLRLVLYKQVSACAHTAEVDELCEEWQDRFGKLPPDVHHLFALIKVRILCKKTLISSLKQTGATVVFSFHPQHQINTSLLADAIKRNPKKFALTREGHFSVKPESLEPANLLAYLLELIGKLTD